MSVEVVRKDIKNLHVAVYPPSGRVRVAVPLAINDEAARLAVVSRMPWIRRQQARFAGQDRQSAREYVTGETHYFLGRCYRLSVVTAPGPPSVSVHDGRTIRLSVPDGSDRGARERAVTSWYRRKLKELVPPLIERWSPRIGVEVDDFSIRQMKTKWGSCNPPTRRILLNLELAKKPLQCTEYIVVHEMVHILERHHGDRFKALMDKLLPKWRLRRDELNSSPLGHQEWNY